MGSHAKNLLYYEMFRKVICASDHRNMIYIYFGYSLGKV